MQTNQAELWSRVAYNLHGYDIEKKCETAKALELEKLQNEMYDKFERTLTDKQRKAFNSLIDISCSVSAEYRDRGIALGMCLAYELRKLLDNPAEAFKQDVESRAAISETYSIEIQNLNNYFKICNKGGDSIA